jgi:transcription initiation factor IIE alpha subunit
MNTATTSIEDRCLEALAKGDFTPDEIANSIGESLLAVRPVMTVLRQLGKVYRTGKRRANDSGKAAHVLTLKPSVNHGIDPVKLGMVEQAKRLEFSKEAAIQLLKSDIDADTLNAAIKRVYGE